MHQIYSSLQGGGCCLPLTNWMIENHLALYLAKYTWSTLQRTSLRFIRCHVVGFFCKHEVRQDVLVNKIHLFRVVADPFLSLELATMARTSFYPLRVKETQSAICNLQFFRCRGWRIISLIVFIVVPDA